MRNPRIFVNNAIIIALIAVYAQSAVAASIYINCGGAAASPFVADVDFSGGAVSSGTTHAINTSKVTNPAPTAVYQSARKATCTYTIPGFTAGSAQTVRLDFCEYAATAAGQRTFDVSINGTQVLTNFDIYATAGGEYIANAQTFSATANSSGQIVIVFTTVVNDSLVAGIEVTAASGGTVPSVPTGLIATPGNAEVVLGWTAVSGATSYSVFRGTSSGGEGTTAIASGITATSYTNTGLTNGTTYYYTVKAVNATGTSGASNEASAAPSSTPNFGPNVYLFTPSTPAATIQSDVNAIYAQQETNQFGTQRYAVLFEPGSYHVDMLVGFYTQVLGLGMTPDDTSVSGYINVNAAWNGGNATQNFWRGMENIAVTPSDANGYSGWAVSQAAPLRRVHILGNLVLADTSVNPPGWASGGFLGDSVVEDEAEPISQQQWLSRNSQWASWSNSVWNMVFVGCVNAPGTTWPSGSNTTADAPTYTTVAETPVVREKPFLNVDSSGNFYVFVPALRSNSVGVDWTGTQSGTNIPISSFYIAHSGTDNAATINTALSAGKDILFTPGVYALGGTINVNNANTVILGIGLPTLQANTGQNAMQIADVDGVTLAGLLFEAGSSVNTLLQVGPAGSSASHSADPTLLADIFTRVGGSVIGQASANVVINSSNVIGDDFWLWRADHGNSGTFGWTVNPSTNGLIVNGQNVTIYGLAVEHFEQYQTLWNGNGGRDYFYQSEAPYDVPNQASWMDGTVDGYASYKVANTVTSHDAWGLGIYCYFNVNPSGVVLQNAIESPSGSSIDFTDMMTDSLGGVGTISSIINGLGGAVDNNNGTTNENTYLAAYE